SLKDPYICGPPSCAESDKFRYLPETIYYYEYKVNVETYFAGSSNNRSTLDIKAEAAIQFIKPCEGLLQLRDVTLLDQDENYPVERAENGPVGQTGARLPRPALSGAGTAAGKGSHHLPQSLVSITNWCAPAAACPIRRWNSCWQGLPPSATEPREYYKLVRACRGLPYPALEQLLARAPTICHRASITTGARLPRPALSGAGTAAGKGSHHLPQSLVSITNWCAPAAACPIRRWNSCWQGLPPSATEPREYYKLVRACRGLPYPALEQLLARAPTICHRASKHMLDALPYIASAGSVELIKDMILKGAVDKEMLTSMLELLKKQQNDQLVSFTVSSMVHSYCKHSGKSLATFVWSHLNNLGQSSLPSRVEIQGLLSGNPMPQLEDSPDFRIKTKINDKLEALRFIRSLSDADQVKEKVDDIGYKNEALKHQYPMAELGIKVFGNEISYWNAEGHSEILKSLERMNPQMRILEILSGKEISYNKASLFLDTTFSVPTGCGLPLNMNLMGTSYVNTKMSGTMVDKFSQSGNLDFEGKIHPSHRRRSQHERHPTQLETVHGNRRGS
ncbi:hypothetical protein MSG28_012727, partial [Choristoneura fumiferana]